MARLKDYYKNDVAPALMKKFSYKSVMQIPKLDKIVILSLIHISEPTRH